MRGAAAADWTGQDRGGVATSTEEPARPRAPQSRGPGPVTDGPRKGEQRRRRRRGGSGDTMSSPSPGKRRMDTDVVKLYPSWRGDSGCNGGGGVGMPRAPPETQSGALGHSRPLFEASSLLSLPPVPTAAPWQTIRQYEDHCLPGFHGEEEGGINRRSTGNFYGGETILCDMVMISV